MLRGEAARTLGWFGRAQRLLDPSSSTASSRDTPWSPPTSSIGPLGDWEAAGAAAGAAAAIAARFGDPDLLALALMVHGATPVRQERLAEGLGKLDEAMAATLAGELSPIVTGLVYCSRIDSCHAVHEPRRASEWTAALTRWCDGARPWAVHGDPPRAPRRAHAAARRMGRRAGGGAPRRRALRPAVERGAAGRASDRQAESCDSEATCRVPRTPIATRAAAATSHSRAWPCCSSRRVDRPGGCRHRPGRGGSDRVG